MKKESDTAQQLHDYLMSLPSDVLEKESQEVKAELQKKIKEDRENHVENYRGFNILFSEENGWYTNFVYHIGLFSDFYTKESLKRAIDNCLDDSDEWDK